MAQAAIVRTPIRVVAIDDHPAVLDAIGRVAIERGADAGTRVSFAWRVPDRPHGGEVSRHRGSPQSVVSAS